MQAYHQPDKEGKLKLRMHGGYQVFADKNPTADIDHALELRKKYKGNRFDIDTIKILLDGVLESRTAYMTEPYIDKGDGAITVALDAFEKANSPAEKRNAITHMQLVQPQDFDRMAKLHVIAVANFRQGTCRHASNRLSRHDGRQSADWTSIRRDSSSARQARNFA